MPDSTGSVIQVLTRPILVGLVIPLILLVTDPWRRQTEAPSLVVGAVVTVAGLAMLAQAGREVVGAEPGRLLTTGLFAHSRNPVHLAVLAILAGLSMASRSPILGVYLLSATVGLHLLVVRVEEPRAEHRFGDRWRHYRDLVPRWFPRPPGLAARR